MNKREHALASAKLAGYHNDTKAYVRLIIESRVNRQAMNQAWVAGLKAKESGVACACYFCKFDRG